MHSVLSLGATISDLTSGPGLTGLAAGGPAFLSPSGVLEAVWPYFLIFVGFSAVIFVHELGHFAVAKWYGIRVERFAIGFFREVWGFTRRGTRYSFNMLPLGGYVKMLGQEDFEIDKSGEISVRNIPDSYSSRSVGQRMAVISAGVIMNVLFAGILFTIVFMIGLPSPVARVGYVRPNWPADCAGILPGDTIKAINGKGIMDFPELKMAIALAEPLEALNFLIERDGQIKNVDIIPINIEEKSVQQIGIGPAITRRIIGVGPGFDPDEENTPRFGDEVVSINGRPVTDENANDLMYMMVLNPSVEAEVLVERPEDPDDPNSPRKRIAMKIPPRIIIRPSDPHDVNTVDILGLRPLVQVDQLDPQGRACLAGMKKGDVILKWGDEPYPTRHQILRETRGLCRKVLGAGPEEYDLTERDIPVRVLRPETGEELDLVVRPKIKRTVAQSISRAVSGRGRGLPRIGATFKILADNLLRIGAVVPEIDGRPSPAAASGIPPGALITKVNTTPVSRWVDLAERLRQHAGQTVTVTYTTGQETEADCELAVPESIRTRLGLTCQARILSINGKDKVKLKLTAKDPGGEREIERDTSIFYPAGLRELLKQHVGRTVEVRYTENPLAPPKMTNMRIDPDMVDPWVGRITYTVDINLMQERKLLQMNNPVSALAIGAKKTYYFIMQVYVVMRRMIFSRSVGVENLSGPVGIVKIGSQMAQAGLPELMFFLAIISANLAVINFLPLPIVDGGHMVFLMIEKIKGSPVSIKVQMATQLVGLVLIITAFLFVTLQDLSK